MYTRLLGGDTHGGVVREHGIEQVQAVVVETGDEGIVPVSLPLGESGLVVGETGDAGPMLFGGGTEKSRRRSVLFRDQV